jgi:Protein of unknown function (DUF3732)
MSMRPNFSIACFAASWVPASSVAISLSLQLFFAGRPESPVPQMLFYDQPSQVYFPRRLVEREGVKGDPWLNGNYQSGAVPPGAKVVGDSVSRATPPRGVGLLSPGRATVAVEP